MTDSVRFPGKWWLPGNEANPVAGVLEISPDGSSQLEVYDEFLNETFVDIIHGHASGKRVTLVNASRRSGKKTIGQAWTTAEQISASLTFIGVHMDSERDEIFSEAVVEISCLTSWVGSSIMTYGLEFDEEKKVKRQLLEAGSPKDLTVSVESWQQDLDFLWRINTQPPAGYTYGIDSHFKETVQLRVRSRKPSSWNSFNDAIRNIQNLVTLASQQGCSVRNRRLGIVLDDRKKWPVNVHYSSSSEWVDAPVERHKFLFQLFDLGEDLTAALNSWFSLGESIGLPLDVLFSLEYSPPAYYENEIFNVASVAEGFHGALFPKSRQIPKAVHSEVVKIASEVFKDHPAESFVTGALAYNRPFLNDRLLQLATIPDAEAVEALLTNVDQWAKWLKDARNAVGHLNTGELERKIPDDARYRLAYVSKALLHLVLVAKLGISADVQRRAVRDLYGYSAREFGKAVTAAMGT